MAEKTSLKDQSIFLVIGNALTQGTSIIQGMILARILTQHDFGSFRQIIMLSYIFYIIFYLSIAESASYYLASLNDKEKKQFVFQTNVLYAFLGLLAFLTLFFTRKYVANAFSNPELEKYLVYTAVFPAFQMFGALFHTSLITVGKAKLNSIISFFQSIFVVLAIAVPLLMGSTFLFAIQILTLANVILFFYNMYVFIKVIGIHPSFNWELLKGQFGFSIPYWISFATYVFYTQIHRLLVSTFFTPEDFALFSVASTELPVLAKLSSQIALVLIPVCIQYMQGGNIQGIINLWVKTAHKVAIVSIPLFVMLTFVSKEFLTILYGDTYGSAWYIFIVMLLLLPLRICDTQSLFKITGKTQYVIYSSLAALIVGLGVGWVLIYPLGLMGPAIGVLAGRITQIAVSLKYINRDLPFTLRQAFVLDVVWKLLLVSIVAFGIGKLFALFIHQPLIHFSIVMVIGGALFMFLSFRFKLLDESDKELVMRWIKLEPLLKS